MIAMGAKGAGYARGASKQNYATPACLIEPVKAMLGIKRFAFDFAADRFNAKADDWWTERDDSLVKTPQDWLDAVGTGWGWLNPPFNDITPWARRCRQLQRLGGSVAFLVPASVGANWHRDWVHDKAYVLFLNGRIPFMPDKPTWGYPKDCYLALYTPGRHAGYDVWSWRED